MNRNSIILPAKHVTHAKLFIVVVLVSVSVIIYIREFGIRKLSKNLVISLLFRNFTV